MKAARLILLTIPLVAICLVAYFSSGAKSFTQISFEWSNGITTSHEPNFLNQKNHSVDVDSEGNIYQFSTINAGEGAMALIAREGAPEVYESDNAVGYVAKIDEGGNEVWRQLIAGEDTNGQLDDDVNIRDGHVTADDNLLAVGSFTSDSLSIELSGGEPEMEEVPAEIVFDAHSYEYDQDVTELFWDHTTADEENRILIVGIAARGDANVTDVYYDGEELTKINHISTGGDIRSELWYLINPQIGTAEIEVYLDREQSVNAVAATYYGIDVDDPIVDDNVAAHPGSPTTTSSVTLNGVENGLTVDMVALQSSNDSINSNAEQDLRIVNANGSATAALSDKQSEESATMAWAFTDDFWAASAVSLRPTTTLAPVNRVLRDDISSESDSSNSLSWEHTVGTDENRILVVAVATRGNAAVVSAEYAGQDMTALNQAANGSDIRTELWYLLNPPTGTGNISLGFNANQTLSAVAVSYSGVDQDMPIVDELSEINDGAGTSTSLVLEGVVGGQVIDVIGLQSPGSTLTIGDSQEEIFNSTAGDVVIGVSDQPAQETTTMEWAFPNDFWATSALSLRPHQPDNPTANFANPDNKQGMLMIKYSPSGEANWVVAQPTGEVAYTSVTSTADGNIFVAGEIQGSNVDLDPSEGEDLFSTPSIADAQTDEMLATKQAFISKFTSDGEYVESVLFYSQPEPLYRQEVHLIKSLDTNSEGELVVIGDFTANAYFDHLGGEPEITADDQVDAGVDPEDEWHSYWAVFNSDLEYQWSHYLDGSGYEHVNDLVIDSRDNLVMVGSFFGEVDFRAGEGTELLSSGDGNGEAYFITKYSSAGNYAWTRVVSGPGDEALWGVAVDSNDGVIAVGASSSLAEGDLDADGTAGEDIFAQGGESPILLTRHTGLGSYDWTQLMGTAPAEGEYSPLQYRGLSVQLNQDDEIIISGLVPITEMPDYDADPSAGTTNPTASIILAKYSQLVTIPDPLYDLNFTTEFTIPNNYQNIGQPQGIAVLEDGSYWYVDAMNSRIVKVSADGQIVRTVGRPGQSQGEFASTPQSITIDDQGWLYVLTNECAVQIFDQNGGFMTQWGECGDEVNQIAAFAHSIYYDPLQNNLLISDTNHSRIVRFSKSGEHLSHFGSEGTEDGQFDRPAGVTTDSEGNIYVVDEFNHRAQVFDADGNHQLTFGSQGHGDSQFQFPKGIVVLSNGEIVVASQNSQRLKKFAQNGDYIDEWGEDGGGDGQFHHPQYLSKDGSDNIFVTDWYHNTIQSFDSDGNHLQSLANGGLENGKFVQPTDVAIDMDGNIYVLDNGVSSSPRIQRFDANGNYLDTLSLPPEIGTAVYFMEYLDDPGGPDALMLTDVDGLYIYLLDLNLVVPTLSDHSFDEARGITFTNDPGLGNLFIVADLFNHRLQMIIGGLGSSVVGSFGDDQGQFNQPESVALSLPDYIVADLNRVQVFNFGINTFKQEVWQYGEVGESIVAKQLDIGGPENDLLFASTTCNLQAYSVEDYSYQFKIGQCGSGVDEFQDVRGMDYNPVVEGQLVVADSDNNRVVAYADGVRIAGLISSTDVLDDESSKSLARAYWDKETPGIHEVDSAMYFGEYLVSDFSVDLSETRNWSDVNAITSPVLDKALVVNLDPVGAPGVSETHSLYVIKKDSHTGVRVCPEASTLEEIHLECENGYELLPGAENLSALSVEGNDYWKIDGLTGTGAMGIASEVDNSDNDDSENDDGDGNQGEDGGSGDAPRCLNCPDNFRLSRPVSQFINDQRPEFKWEFDEIRGSAYFKLAIDNGAAGGNWEIDHIPLREPETIDEKKYQLKYPSDYDENNTTGDFFVTAKTKSSGDWQDDEYQGKLREGRRKWSVTAVAGPGGRIKKTGEVFVDLTAPELRGIAISTDGQEVFLTGKVTDKKRGSNPDRSDYIRSNPSKVELNLRKVRTLLPDVMVGEAVYDIQSEHCDVSASADDLWCSFAVGFVAGEGPGEYAAQVTVFDHAGNSSTYDEQLILGGADVGTDGSGDNSDGGSDSDDSSTGGDDDIGGAVGDGEGIGSDSESDDQSQVGLINDILGDRVLAVKELRDSFSEMISQVRSQLQSNPLTLAVGKAADTLTVVGASAITTISLVGAAQAVATAKTVFQTTSATGVIPGVRAAINYLAQLAATFVPAIGVVRMRTRRSVGVALDVAAGLPLSAVYLVFFSKSGRLKSAVTNRDGRYTILLDPDQYQINANRHGYQMAPANNLAKLDTTFTQIYIPGQLLSLGQKQFANLAIGMIERGDKSTLLGKLRNLNSLVLSKIRKFGEPLLVISLLLSGYAWLVTPGRVNYLTLVVLLVTCVVYLYHSLMLRKNAGVVVAKTGPAAGLRVELYKQVSGQSELYTTTETDTRGRYLLSPENGQYQVKIISQSGKELSSFSTVVSNRQPLIKRVVKI